MSAPIPNSYNANAGNISSRVSSTAPDSGTPPTVLGEEIYVLNQGTVFKNYGEDPQTGFVWRQIYPPTTVNSPPTGSLYYTGTQVEGIPLDQPYQFLGTDSTGTPSQISIQGSTGIDVTLSGDLLTITNTAIGLVDNFSTVSVNTPLITNQGYIVTTPAEVTLPATASLGDVIVVVALVAGVKILQQGSTQIQFPSSNQTATLTTAGTGYYQAGVAGASVILTYAATDLWVASPEGGWISDTSLLSLPTGTISNRGIMYVPLNQSVQTTLPVPVSPNYQLVSSSSGVPVFAAPPANIAINKTGGYTTGIAYPNNGSAPITASTDFTASTIPYQSAAFTGYSITSPVPRSSSSRIIATIDFYVYALGQVSSGFSQQLSLLKCAWFTSQTATNAVAQTTVGSQALSTSYSHHVTSKIILNSSSYPSGVTLYLCLFFDSNVVATVPMQAVVCGSISSTTNLVTSDTGAVIAYSFEEDVSSSSYNP